MAQEKPTTAKSAGFDEVVEIQHRRRRKKRLQRLYSVSRQSPGVGGYYIKMEVFVPHPSYDFPYPAVFLLIQNSAGKVWQRFESVEAIQGFLGLNDQDLAGLAEAFNNARELGQDLEQAQRATNEAFSELRNQKSEEGFSENLRDSENQRN